MTTETPNAIESIFIVPILMVGVVTFSMSRTFRRFGIGLTAMCIACAFFLVFYLNKNLATEGNYENFKLKDAMWIDNGFFLKINFNMWYNLIEVTQEKCLIVDSIQIRIDKGFFGMRTITNDVRIVESSNCDYEDVDTTDLTKSHFSIGHYLAQKRCFSEAIHHYSNCIELDSLCTDCRYHRGLIFMAKEEYDKALLDFLTSATIKYLQLDEKKVETITNINLLSYTKELFSKIENKDYEYIEEYADNISTINDFDKYFKRIEFCLKKLTEK
jgi:tetratricopeptide (TPR) repeat protein